MRSKDGRFEYRKLDGRPVEPGTDPRDVHRFAFRCRLDPRNMCSVNLRDRGHDIPKKSWTWNGDVEKPTLEPSIDCEKCWHGFITAGVFMTSNRTPEEKQ